MHWARVLQIAFVQWLAGNVFLTSAAGPASRSPPCLTLLDERRGQRSTEQGFQAGLVYTPQIDREHRRQGFGAGVQGGDGLSNEGGRRLHPMLTGFQVGRQLG